MLTAAGALVGATAVSAPAVVDRVLHPREVAAFHEYTETYIDQWWRSDHVDPSERDLAWLQTHRDEALALGDGACAWLRTQDDAPDVDPTGRTSWEARKDAALRSTRLGSSTDLSAEDKYVLLGGAWSHLCSGVLDAKTAPRSVSEYDD